MASRWEAMDAQPRLGLATLTRSDVPTDPGVYALYRYDERMYVGKASSLRQRIWNQHCGRGRVMTGSAMRRNVAQHLGISTALAIKSGQYQPTDDEVRHVRVWMETCHIAWRVCDTDALAARLERDMKAEFMPTLTRQ